MKQTNNERSNIIDVEVFLDLDIEHVDLLTVAIAAHSGRLSLCSLLGLLLLLLHELLLRLQVHLDELLLAALCLFLLRLLKRLFLFLFLGCSCFSLLIMIVFLVVIFVIVVVFILLSFPKM